MILELMSTWDSGNGVQSVFVQKFPSPKVLILKHGVGSSELSGLWSGVVFVHRNSFSSHGLCDFVQF